MHSARGGGGIAPVEAAVRTTSAHVDHRTRAKHCPGASTVALTPPPRRPWPELHAARPVTRTARHAKAAALHGEQSVVKKRTAPRTRARRPRMRARSSTSRTGAAAASRTRSPHRTEGRARRANGTQASARKARNPAPTTVGQQLRRTPRHGSADAAKAHAGPTSVSRDVSARMPYRQEPTCVGVCRLRTSSIAAIKAGRRKSNPAARMPAAGGTR